MLTGAYYLARKWGCAKRAEEAKAALFTCDLVNVNHLPEPAEIVDAVLASQVAEFTFSRYAPSRFWGT